MYELKVFVATKETQGKRDNDFFWSKEGELVLFPFECDGEEIDGGCGCRRCMSGFETHKSTTTFKVKVLSRTSYWYIDQYKKAMRDAGWAKLGLKDSEMNREARRLIKAAAKFNAGDVLERRGEKIHVRRKGEEGK